MLGLSTLSHQPDFREDFPAYARYITTDSFLSSHIFLTIGGAALGSIGVASLLAYLARMRGRRFSMIGAAFTLAANVVSASVFGAAAFVQPAIGRAYLDGMKGVERLNSDVYGSTLDAVAGSGILLFLVGGIMLGVGVARAHPALRGLGILYVAGFAGFLFGGVFLTPIQAASAIVIALAAAGMAYKIPRFAS